MFWMCLIWRGLLNTSLASAPPNPFSLVRKGTLCHAEKLSSWVHVCQPVVNGQACPEALSFAIAPTTSGHVCGARLGSSPAFSNASLLYQNTVVELLNGNDSIWPFALV